MDIDLKKEQEVTLARPVRDYGILARLLFISMDILYGKKLTLGKARILEILARVPYQAWEIRQYHRMNRHFSESPAVNEAEDMIRWGRDAQDNEFWHLIVIDEKIKQEGIKLSWLKGRLIPMVAVFQYNIVSRLLALLNIKAAISLNADFEDHAEHEYMEFVMKHPELDEKPASPKVIGNRTELKTWGDVFRRIALDERDHMNNSLKRCGKESEVVPYLSKED